MVVNRILDVIITGLAWIVGPILIVTTLVLSILVSLSFGLLLLPISLVWIILSFPLIGASWLCNKIEVLRNLIGILGIPWAVVAHTYCCLMPSMGEVEGRADKLLLAESWPYCWEYWQFTTGQLDIDSTEAETLNELLKRVSRNDLVKQGTIDRISRREQLDPCVN